MGCFDVYCHLCGAPFFPTDYHPSARGVDVAWMNSAVVTFRDTGYRLPVRDYDSYGGFTVVQTGEHKRFDVYGGNVEVAHATCLTVPEIARLRRGVLRRYHEQFFDVESAVAHGHKVLLTRPGLLERRVVDRWRSFVLRRRRRS